MFMKMERNDIGRPSIFFQSVSSHLRIFEEDNKITKKQAQLRCFHHF